MATRQNHTALPFEMCLSQQVKFGVKRERVPFVLAHDFEIIIEKHFGFDK